MINNLHIIPGHIDHATRLFKETHSLVRSELVGHVYISCFGKPGEAKVSNKDEKRTICRIHEKKTTDTHSFLSRIVDIIKFSTKTFQFARKNNISIVNVHSVALLPLGSLIKLICGAKLVYDAHELETETHAKGFIAKLIAKAIETSLIRFVDLTIVVGDGIKLWYQEKYGIENIVTVMNCPAYQKAITSNILKEELGISQERRVVLYQGAFFKGRGLEKLLKAFSEHDDQSHCLICMGFGPLESLVKEYASTHKNIFFQKAPAPEDIQKYTASADIGVSYIDGNCLSYYLCLPNKLFEYIMAGLPVLINNIPEMKRVVEGNNLGAVIEEDTSQDIYKKLTEISMMNSANLKENLKLSAKHYCWEKQEECMLDAYKKFIFD